MTDLLLDVEALDVRYGSGAQGTMALQGVGLQMARGEIVGVVGESGCGKSSLALALLRLLPANGQITQGRVSLRGTDLLGLGAEGMRRIRGTELGVVFQDPRISMNPLLNVGEQMKDADRAHLNGGDRRRVDGRARHAEALAAVGIPDARKRLRGFPHEFSGGQLQRAMIAMALLQRPPLLIADEPTSALDVTLEAQILELLLQLRHEHGTAILFISHDLGAVARLCDRVVVMYAGRVVEEIDAAALLDRPQHPYTQALIASVPSAEQRGRPLRGIPGRVPMLTELPQACTFAPRCALVRDICTRTEPGLYDTASGRVRCHIYDPSLAGQWNLAERGLRGDGETKAQVAQLRKSQPTPDALVRVRGLKVHFDSRETLLARVTRSTEGPVRAVDGVSMDVFRGEILGLVGESGSGKTTLGQCMLGIVPPTAGEVAFDGEDVHGFGRRALKRFRSRAQMVFQEPHSSLSPRLRVGALISEPYEIQRVPVGERQSVGELLEMVGLSDELASKYPGLLSGGQARRVGIARALAGRPEFVVADEPTSGLDASSGAAVLNLMMSLREELSLTYLVITHNLGLVTYMADRIAVMYLGEIVELARSEQVANDAAHPYTRALLATDARTRGGARHRLLAPGEIPSPRNPPPGCRFHTRCAFARDRCRVESPQVTQVEPEHVVACHFWREIRASLT